MAPVKQQDRNVGSLKGRWEGILRNRMRLKILREEETTLGSAPTADAREEASKGSKGRN